MREWMLCSFLAVLLQCVGFAAEPAPQPVDIEFSDQFDNKPRLQGLRGKVAVLVYADRKGVDASKAFGENLHLAFHPTAKGLTPAKARLEPTIALASVQPGKAAPAVSVVPVAIVGKVPELVRSALRTQLRVVSPDVPVWLDFDESLVKRFGLTTGEVNVAVFDVNGIYRYGFTGSPDSKRQQELVQVIQNLRSEGCK